MARSRELTGVSWTDFGRLKLLALGASMLAGGIASVSSAEQSFTKPASVIQLFNGTNLTGWYSWLVDTRREDPRGVFGVTNEMIRISGNGLGYLATDREFRDYHLVVEFKWGRSNWVWGDRVGKARDSGIFLHSIGPDGNSHDGNGAFRAAIECQIMQGSVGDLLLIRGRAGDGSLIAPHVSVLAAANLDADGWPYWQLGGCPRMLERWGRVNWWGKATNWIDHIDFRGLQDVESPFGQWTRVECICAGDTISVTVNGKTVNEVRDVFPKAGSILLQCEGSEIFFRRVELRPLPGATAAPAP